MAATYVRTHRVFVFHGNEPVEVEAEDRLVLTNSDGGLRVSLLINAEGGARCELEGVAHPRWGAFELRPLSVENCVLRLRAEDSRILIEDVENGCRAAFCGERASIGRLTFRQPDRNGS